jgi:lipopolysaccharide/colanic/teichoic acid biosynthesis glycosyltransferase
MSLVGPRPLPVIENRYSGAQIQRLSVKPGITCIWQVSGRSSVTFGEWMEMDLSYVADRTLLKDLWLLVRTVPAVLGARGACSR